MTAHDEALTFGGHHGVSSLHLIESALARPYEGYHRAISRKAAAILHSTAGNHGYVDGNKRTAWLLVEILIDRSGYRLNVPDEERIDDLVVAVATGQVEFDPLASWFKGTAGAHSGPKASPATSHARCCKPQESGRKACARCGMVTSRGSGCRRGWAVCCNQGLEII